MVVQKTSIVYHHCNEDEIPRTEGGNLLVRAARAVIKPRTSTPGPTSIPLPPPEDTSSTISEVSSTDNTEVERGTWGRQLDFFLSCVGYAVGLGNIWRFPYLCYKSGGGAFLIPYLLFLLLCGMPLVLLEMSFGQFASRGPIAIWEISPLFKGLGYGMVLISTIVCIYYNVIIAWTLYFMYQSYSVPWGTCGNPWNTPNCVDHEMQSSISSNSTLFGNSTDTNFTSTLEDISALLKNRTTASEEFWLYKVLQQSSGIEDIGRIQWPLVLCLAIAWICVFLCLVRGVKSSGKVVYVSATLPYVVLIGLLIRGVTLPGAWQGILFYVSPRWELLGSFQVWADAATQIFYSVGGAWGAILTMSSYNKFSNNVYRDALVIPVINCGTSIFAGFVVFSIIGFMSHETGKSIKDVVSEGPGLAFIVYPEAVARLPFSPIWAFLFFIMLFNVGLGSMFAMFETAISSFCDEFPNVLRRRKLAFTGFLCVLSFLGGLPCLTQGGIYILQLMDWYSATFGLMIIALFEMIVLSWIYGVDRFMQDINLMIKRVPNCWWKLCWCCITPLTIICLLIVMIINHKAVTYNKYEYPAWSVAVGWVMAMCPLVPIPVVAIIQMMKANGSFRERLLTCLRPSPEWGPVLEEHRIRYKKSLSLISSRLPQLEISGLERNPSEVTNMTSNTSENSKSTNLDSVLIQTESTV